MIYKRKISYNRVYNNTVYFSLGLNLFHNGEFYFLVVKAKMEWPADAVAQVLAEAGCFLKKRLAAGKETPVFTILTNGLYYRLFAINTDSVVYSSGIIILKFGNDGTFNSSS
jgi:hypothetical protein